MFYNETQKMSLKLARKSNHLKKRKKEKKRKKKLEKKIGFRDPASPPTPGSVFANQTSFAHLQEPWDFLRCCVLRILSNERNRICLLPPPPLGLSGPRLSASSSSPRLLFNLVMRNFSTLANNRYSMTLQLQDRRDKSASLESSPNAPELFRASWVRGDIA